jgi:ABC-2 type transport system ATP-binding protein
MTVWEYLIFSGMLSGLTRSETAQRASLLLKEVDLYSFRDKMPVEFASGMKTKIAIVQSFLACPRLVLMDEPVSGLDETGKQSILRIIQELSFMHGSTVILSARDWTDIGNIAAGITLINDGKLLISAETGEVRNLYSFGIFRLDTSDNEKLLNILPRLPYLQQIIRDENDSVIVLTKAKAQFRKDFPTIIHAIETELIYFCEEELNQEILMRYLLPAGEAE